MAEKRSEIVVAANFPSLIESAAKRIAARISNAGSRSAICLTGGSTPKPLYQRLAAEPYRSELPWNTIHWFWGDDRFVPLGDERSNAGMARAAFLDQLPVPAANIHAIPTNTASPHDAARLYEAELRGFYGGNVLDPQRPLFDLVLMGLGSDGHTASLFPGQPALNETDRWVVGVEQAGLAPFVPRVSLTFVALASTREMMFLVSGREKRNAVDRALAGEDVPAARAHAVGTLVWLMDRDAAPESYSGSAGGTA
ncbi:MAG: 6-phosphogluconolactonase [Xanthobacteraceae bacterium]